MTDHKAQFDVDIIDALQRSQAAPARIITGIRSEVRVRCQAFNDDVGRRGGSQWRIDREAADGDCYAWSNLRVIWSAMVQQDGETWLHVSVSRQPMELGRLPSYNDMAMVKRLFVGPDRIAYSVWAPDVEHVNLHPVLHLWAPITGEPPLPDFTWGLGTI